LEKDLGEIPKTLFFEYQNLNDLKGYFIDNHPDHFKHRSGSTIGRPAEVLSVTDAPSASSRNRFANAPQLQSRVTGNMGFHGSSDIAIIGLGGRYPQAANLDAFWQNLKKGKDCISEIPAERWELHNFYDPKKGVSGKSYSKWGGFLDDVDLFDPLFFNITPREAEQLDPQERIFLEVVWETIENAGYSKAELNTNRVGVFAGVMYGQYQYYGLE
jgi:hypothetical protein